MTAQQLADIELQCWQTNRALTPEQRIEILLYDFLSPPLITEAEYDIVLNRVQEAILQ